MSLRFATSIFAGIFLLISATAVAAPGKAKPEPGPRMFGKGHVFAIWDLPRGRVRETMERLPWRARERAMDWLKRFEFPAADLEHIQVDDEGAVFYAEPVPEFPEESPESAQGPGADDGGSEPATAAAAAADNAFLLHSRPGSPNVLYLDFDGHVISGTAWNSSYDPLDAKPFDLDGDPSTFNEAERTAIAEIWHRVAEDLAAFDIDVTTEDPVTFDRYTGRVLITNKTDANGRAMPQNSGGGVAYIGVWGRSTYERYSPALVYYDNLGKDTTRIAEASSHEFGHNLGLSHDGSGGTTYYSGHGSGFTSWAPIMGNPYSKNVTQWSKGEYSGANNTQDDIAVITAALGLAEDDHADSRAMATPLIIDGDGSVAVSDPETDPDNLYPENKGIIDSPDDSDYFSFTAAGGTVELTVNPSWQAFYRSSKRGGNLDIRAALLDGDGNVIVESDPSSDTYASVSASVPAGTYFLAVTGVGNGNYSSYASQGQYFVSGSLASEPNTPPTAGFSSVCTELNCSFIDGSSDSDGSVVAWSWDFGDGNTSTTRSPSHTYAAGGSYTVRLTATDDDGATDVSSQTIVVEPPNTAPAAGFGQSCTGLDCSFSDTSSDSDGSIASWFWDFGDGNTSTAQSPSHSYAAGGSYTVTQTVTDDDGAADVSTQTVSVITPNLAPSASFGQSCTDLGCSFSDTSSDSDGLIVSWSWDFGDGNTSTSQSPNHTYLAGGSYTVSLTVTDDDGATDSTSQTVTVEAPNTAPSAGFGYNCTDLDCSFIDTSSDSDGSIVSWAWDFGDGSTSTAQSPSHSYAAGGSYTVSLTVTDDNGATGTFSQSVGLQRPLPQVLQCLKRHKLERCIVALGQNPPAGQNPPTGQSPGYVDANDSSDTLSQEANDDVVAADASGHADTQQPGVAQQAASQDDELLPMRGTYRHQGSDGAWTGNSVSLTLSSDGDDPIGLVFRIADSNSNYRFYWDNQGGSRRLEKEVNGSFTLLAEDRIPFVTGQAYQVEIGAAGGLIEISVDGVVVFSLEDSALVTAAAAF